MKFTDFGDRIDSGDFSYHIRTPLVEALVLYASVIHASTVMLREWRRPLLSFEQSELWEIRERERERLTSVGMACTGCTITFIIVVISTTWWWELERYFNCSYICWKNEKRLSNLDVIFVFRNLTAGSFHGRSNRNYRTKRFRVGYVESIEVSWNFSNAQILVGWSITYRTVFVIFAQSLSFLWKYDWISFGMVFFFLEEIYIIARRWISSCCFPLSTFKHIINSWWLHYCPERPMRLNC